MAVRGRFAPSPSGRIHLGNALAYLLAWLSARSRGGEIVLRIENLDTARCKPHYITQLADDLRWLGLDWDCGGDDFRQSERSELYAEYLRKISEEAEVYPCTCTRAELHTASAPHASDDTPIYNGHCYETRKSAPGSVSAAALRVHVPDLDITFCDRLYGDFSENLMRDCGDFVLRRSDGVFAYQLAVVVDDALSGVTEVVRGRDLLGSTARQIWLHQLIGNFPPSFAHTPLCVAPDGRRLSKRDGDMSFEVLRARYHPQELVGILAATCGLLDTYEAVTAGELVPLFDWTRIKTADIDVYACLF